MSNPNFYSKGTVKAIVSMLENIDRARDCPVAPKNVMVALAIEQIKSGIFINRKISDKFSVENAIKDVDVGKFIPYKMFTPSFEEDYAKKVCKRVRISSFRRDSLDSFL
jgi:hypothetical protein